MLNPAPRIIVSAVFMSHITPQPPVAIDFIVPVLRGSVRDAEKHKCDGC